MSVTQPTDAQKQTALQRLKALPPGLLQGAAKGLIYLTAGVTAYCLLPGNSVGLAIPAMLLPLIEAIGGDLLASVVERIASGKEKSDDEIFAILQEAATQSKLNAQTLANLPTKRELYRAISLLGEQAQQNQQQLVDLHEESHAMLRQLLATRPTDLPLFVGVPAMPNHFVGREELLTDLAARLTSGESLALSTEGLPGVGKTTLAVALAYHSNVLDTFSDGVLWAGLGQTPDVPGNLAAWAEALGGDVTSLAEERERKEAVKRLIGQRHLLLVLDDTWDGEAADYLRCGGPNCVHLLTTRDKAIATQFAGGQRALNVPTLADDPAFDLLQKLAPEVCAAHPNEARQLAQAVGGLPLALELLGGYLAAPRHSLRPGLRQKALATLADPQARLELAAKRLGSVTGRMRTLREAIALSLNGLEAEEGGEATARAFYALGAFAPKPVAFSWQAATAVADCEEETIAWLVERNLVEAEEDNLLLHQTLAEVAREKQPPEATDRCQDYYLDLVNADQNNWQEIEAVYEQIRHCWQWLPEDEKVLDWVWAMRIYQERRGLWHDKIAWAARGLKIAKMKELQVAEASMHVNLGYAYNGLGQREQALHYYNRALLISKEVGDQDGLATILTSIGNIYDNLGQREEALSYHNQALPIMEKSEHPEGLAATLNNIGLIYDNSGQFEKAIAYYKRALAISKEIGDWTGQGTALNNIGTIYLKIGQWETALAYFNKALIIWKQVGDRSGLGKVLTSIGHIYEKWGKWKDALAHYNQALTINQAIEDQAGVAIVLNYIGHVHARIGQHNEALAYYHRALSIMEKIGDQPAIAMMLTNIGLVYHRLSQWQHALRYLNRALPILEKVKDKAGMATALNNLGLVFNSVGQSKEALAYYHQALSIMKKIGDKAGMAVTLSNIGSIYDSLGHRRKALGYFNRALPISEEIGDQYQESVTRYNLALLLRAEGRLQEAVAQLRKVVVLDRQVQHPDLEADLAVLAQVEAELATQQSNDSGRF